jgi:hypothetical protein
VFVLAFVVEIVVGYNPIMHKTQPQKLIFLVFYSFLVGSTPKPQPPTLTQTPSQNQQAPHATTVRFLRLFLANVL